MGGLCSSVSVCVSVYVCVNCVKLAAFTMIFTSPFTLTSLSADLHVRMNFCKKWGWMGRKRVDKSRLVFRWGKRRAVQNVDDRTGPWAGRSLEMRKLRIIDRRLSPLTV